MVKKPDFIYPVGFLCAVCFMLVFLITSVEAIAYWTPGYYEAEYTKYQVLDDLPEMTMDDLLEVTDEMMAFLRGEREDLHVFTTMGGEYREFFNEREIAHMNDVRGLFLGGLMLRRICLVIIAACFIGLFAWAGMGAADTPGSESDVQKGSISLYAKVKTRNSGNLSAAPAAAGSGSGSRKARFAALHVLLPKALCIGTGIFFAAAVLIAAIVATDFSRYFVVFHHIFFNNDLWLLDPRTDMLINIVPEPFFMDTARQIGIIFAFMVLVFFCFCLETWSRGASKQK